MLIVGDKIRKRNDGYCADFCPVCRAVRAFSITELNKVSHVYYIPLGRGESVGKEKACTVCRSPMSVESRGVLTCRDPRDMDAMLANVPHHTRARWKETIEEDARIQENPDELTPELRMRRIVDMFIGLEPMLGADLGGSTNVSWAMVKGLLLWCLIWLSTALFRDAMANWRLVRAVCEMTGLDPLGLGLLAVVGSGFVIPLYLVATQTSRYFRLKVFPRLVPRLHPLQPSREELVKIKGAIKGGGYRIARFSVKRLDAAIRAYQP